MFRVAAVVLAFLAGSVSATTVLPNNIPANSRLGSRLLSEARALGNNNNNNYDFSWAADYQIRYVGCSTLVQYNGYNNGNNNNNKNNNNKNSMVSTTSVVKFSLCPSSETCGSCSDGGDYVVSMQTFVELWSEAKMNAKEYACEQIRENCDCDDANDDEKCETQCYYNAGRSDCIAEEEEYPEDFELQRYLECKELENKNKNNNNNNNNNGGNGYGDDDSYNSYYVGAYCASDGVSVHLGVFTDAYCSVKSSKDGIFEKRYGATLPYSTKSIIARECMDCGYGDDNNNNNNNKNNNDGVSQLCYNNYALAAKCEINLKVDYPDTTGCQYINNVLPRVSSTKISSESSVFRSGGSRASKAFAWLFAISTIVLGAYAFFLYRKIHRSKVDLSHSADAAMA